MRKKNVMKLCVAMFAFSFIAGVTAVNTTTAKATDVPVSMHTAAAIRTVAPSGIRFYGQITDDCYNAITSDTTMGVSVSFTYNGTVVTNQEKTIDNATLYQKDGVWTYNAVISDLPEDAYNVEFSVKAFVQMNASAEKQYSTTTTTHSIAYIAGEALRAGATDDIYTTIVGKASENVALSDTAISVAKGESKQVTYSGTTVQYATYTIDNEDVATVDENGNVTGVAKGNTTLTVQIGNVTKTCAVTVTEIEPTAIGNFETELARNSETHVVSNEISSTDLVDAITAKETNAVITSATQTIGEDTYTLAYDATNSKFTNVQAGESQIVITTESGAQYSASVSVCTLILTEDDDVLLMTQILEANKVRSTATVNDKVYPVFSSGGYFVLKQDINYKATFKSQFKLSDTSTYISAENGFTGVFDGRGHTISNLTMTKNTVTTTVGTDTETGVALRSSGLFTAVAESGVVKNVTLTGNSTGSYAYSSMIGLTIAGTLQNVKTERTNTGTLQNNGILCARAASTARFENVIVDITGGAPTINGSNWGLLWSYCNSDMTVKGVYVIGARADAKRSSGYIWCGNNTQNGNTLAAISNSGDCAAYFSSVKNFKDGVETTAFANDTVYTETTETHNAWTYINANFDENIWNLSGDIPALKAQ